MIINRSLFQLVRRVTRHLFSVLHKKSWPVELLKQLRKEICATVLKEGVLSFGCTMHFLSLFWEEVAKVSDGQISTKAVTGLILPFLAFLTDTHDQRLSKRVVVDIFYGLLKQSDLGKQHEEKYEVWKQFGFPFENINDIEMVEDEEAAPGEEDEEEMEEEEEEAQEVVNGANDNELPPEQLALDPRAGNVSVVLPEVPFNAKKIYDLMEKAIYDAGTRSLNRRVIKKVMAKYEKFCRGEYPLGIQRTALPAKEAAKMPNIMQKAEELENLQDEVFEVSRLWKTLNKGEKKRFYRSGMTEVEYLEHLGKLTDPSNGVMVVEEAEEADQNDPATKKTKRKSSGENGIAGGDGKNKKAKRSQEAATADTSIELDNGFEVEESVEDKVVDPVAQSKPKQKATGDSPSPKQQQKKQKQRKDKQKPTTNGAVFELQSEWDKPLQEGEIEYTLTPTKQRLKHLNGDLEDRAVARNPFAKQTPQKPKKNTLNVPGGVTGSPKTPVNKAAVAAGQLNTPNSSGKRVKIVLEKNMAQEKSEYFRQLRASPQIPFDSSKKPTKGLLKPHSMPSPINPYYKQKIGLKLDGE